MSCLFIYLVVELGKPSFDNNGKLIMDDYSNMVTWKQYLFRTFGELNYYKKVSKYNDICITLYNYGFMCVVN